MLLEAGRLGALAGVVSIWLACFWVAVSTVHQARTLKRRERGE